MEAIELKNKFFEIEFNKENGAVTSIINPADEHKMNWCIENAGWGLIYYNNTFYIDPLYKRENSVEAVEMTEFYEDESYCRAEFANDTLKITTERFFTDDGCYNERYTIKNLRETDFFLEQGTLGINVPFNDIYTYADDCMVNHCNTHIWCGENTTYINALKMGESEINLGLVLTKGAIKNYSVKNCKTNHRAACAACAATFRDDIQQERQLLDHLIQKLSALPGVVINGIHEAPHILSLSIPGVPTQNSINILQDAGICVYAGSACAKGHRSHVLTAMGIPGDVMDGSFRISVFRDTTEAELDALVFQIQTNILPRARR